MTESQIKAFEAESPVKLDLLEQQVISEEASVKMTESQIKAFEAETPIKLDLLEQQVLSETAKRETVDAQLVAFKSKAPLEDELLERQISNQKSQTDAIISKTWADKEDHEAKMVMAEELLQTEDGKQAMQAAQIITEGKKQLLMAAQTLGFKSDTKQKVLKQMLDGYAVNLSIAGTANVPETVLEQSIDQLSQEILTDIGSTVVIQSTVQNAALEVATP
jgi:environmental stress-induced protein Ves